MTTLNVKEYMGMEFPIITREEIKASQLSATPIDPLTEVIMEHSLTVLNESYEVIAELSGEYVLAEKTQVAKNGAVDLNERYILLPAGHSAYINPKSLVQVEL